MYYKCMECGCIHTEKVKECEACREELIEEVEGLELEDIVNLIRDYQYRGDNDIVDDVIDYWDLFHYVESIIGEQVYGNFDKALKVAEDRNIAIKRELVYFPDY